MLKRAPQTELDNDLEQTPNFVFKGTDTFARFLVIISPFIIQNQIESIIRTPNSVKKN